MFPILSYYDLNTFKPNLANLKKLVLFFANHFHNQEVAINVFVVCLHLHIHIQEPTGKKKGMITQQSVNRNVDLDYMHTWLFSLCFFISYSFIINIRCSYDKEYNFQ